ncbi:MAG: hypothetical protein LC746_17670 [Acidobacteria bacterium]|nr:hypothetical protein [Acidobacteriota bacterium]
MKAERETSTYLRQLDHGLHRAKLLLKRSGFSNFDEERILRRYVDTLLAPRHSPIAVDLGAGDGVKGSNTFALFAAGWRGLGVEMSARRAGRLAKTYEQFPHVEAVCARVTPQSVGALLREHKVPRDFSVLSLDIDSYDYFVLDALLSEFRPQLVVTEINEKIPPPVRFHVKYDADFQLRHHFYGYSIQSLAELCARRGYAILELEYNNAFIAPAELAGDSRASAEEIYRRGYLERADRRKKFSSNRDVDVLHTLSPAEAVKFINRFFAKHRGKYELSLG